MPDPIGRTITREQINALPLWAYTGPIVMIEDQETARRAAIHLAAADAIGIDTETRPAFRKGEQYPVSLIQLAIDDVVFLLRLNQHGLFRHIAEILEDPDLPKVGIGTRDDVRELQRDFGCSPKGVRSIDKDFRGRGFQVTSARKLTALVLGNRISKRQQTSNWAVPTLTPAQISYAATDAWIALELWKYLQGTPR